MDGMKPSNLEESSFAREDISFFDQQAVAGEYNSEESMRENSMSNKEAGYIDESVRLFSPDLFFENWIYNLKILWRNELSIF